VQKRHTAAARSVISILTCSGGSKSTSSSSFSSSAWFGWYNTTVGCVGSEEANDALLVVLDKWGVERRVCGLKKRRGAGIVGGVVLVVWGVTYGIDSLTSLFKGCRRRTHPRTGTNAICPRGKKNVHTTHVANSPASLSSSMCTENSSWICNLVLSYIFYKLLPTEVFVRKNCCLSHIK